MHPYVERFHEVFGHRLRLVRYLGAGLLALIVALPTTSQWQSWLLFRNSQSFGMSDAQFDADVGFYVFELPFLGFVLDWLFVAMVLVLVITLLAHVLNGGVVFASPVPSVRPATKGHIAVLLAVLAALKAADYWVTRYETTNERRGFVQGATYAVVNAQLPALMLLMLIALLTAGLYLATMRRASWRLPLIASGLWLVVLVVGGYIYPAARPVARRQPEPAVARGAVHHAQRRGDAARRWASTVIDQVERSPSVRSTADEVEADLAAAAGRPPAQPGRDAVAVPDRPGAGGRAVDRRPRRRPLRARRRAPAGAHRRPRARPRRASRTRAGRAATSSTPAAAGS